MARLFRKQLFYSSLSTLFEMDFSNSIYKYIEFILLPQYTSSHLCLPIRNRIIPSNNSIHLSQKRQVINHPGENDHLASS